MAYKATSDGHRRPATIVLFDCISQDTSPTKSWGGREERGTKSISSNMP